MDERLSGRAYVNDYDTRINPTNPFVNPTEEPDYTPDYTAIVPQIAIPGCRIPLLPSRRETRSIRKYYSLAGFMLFFDYFLASGIANCLYLLFTFCLRGVDKAAVGTLPGNYFKIAQSYMEDSSVLIGVNLLAFLIANVATFFVGCKLTKIKPSSLFADHKLTVGSTLRYVAIGLWIQLAMGYVASWLESLLSAAGYSVFEPDFSTGSSPTKLLLTVLYACLVAPITEELVFRGLFLKNMSRVSQRFGIFLSAFFFALAHGNLAQGLLAFSLGILLGYITIKHHSLVPAIIVHFVINVVSTIFTFLYETQPNASKKLDVIFAIVVFAVGTAALVYTFLTERLPDNMPHQSIRCMRVAVCSWGLWLALLVHLGSMVLTPLLQKFAGNA